MNVCERQLTFECHIINAAIKKETKNDDAKL